MEPCAAVHTHEPSCPPSRSRTCRHPGILKRFPPRISVTGQSSGQRSHGRDTGVSPLVTHSVPGTSPLSWGDPRGWWWRHLRVGPPEAPCSHVGTPRPGADPPPLTCFRRYSRRKASCALRSPTSPSTSDFQGSFTTQVRRASAPSAGRRTGAHCEGTPGTRAAHGATGGVLGRAGAPSASSCAPARPGEEAKGPRAEWDLRLAPQHSVGSTVTMTMVTVTPHE